MLDKQDKSDMVFAALNIDKSAKRMASNLVSLLSANTTADATT